ncbi:MAG: DUF4402 domain-containing protein [Sphingomonadaceae bacterium]|nr:DUF4402 domain-containing protein [Sphingomonadaceae bacterium]
MPAPAQAQSVATPVQIVVLKPLSILKTEDMDFGDILETGAGAVVMTPSITPTCVEDNTNLIHSGNCQPAEFVGVGSPNQIMRIKKPAGGQILLTGPGTDMLIANIVIDGSPSLQLVVNGNGNGNAGGNGNGFVRYRIVSTDGYWEFRVGGTLNVPSGQTPGVYTGTFQIDVSYN